METQVQAPTPELADPLLTPAEVARMLRISKFTLVDWRARRKHGLKFIRLGWQVRYRLSDVENFLNLPARQRDDAERPRRSLKRSGAKAEPRA
jgi:excisionase family DNA binding protein